MDIWTIFFVGGMSAITLLLPSLLIALAVLTRAPAAAHKVKSAH